MPEKKKFFADPANFFLVIALILGIFYCVAIPYGAGFDEERHMVRVYYMAQGHVLPNFPGQVINEDIADLSYQRRLVQTPAFDMFSRDLFLRRFSTLDQYRYEQRTQSIYSPVIFLPQAVIGRYLWWKFDFPILPTILLQKITGMLIYIAGAYVMIRVMPYGKWILAALALMPSAMYQAATVNADGFTTAVSFAFIGYVLHVHAKETSGVTARSVWILFFLSLLLGAAKPGAVVLLPLLLILYRNLLPSKKWMGLLILGVLLAIVINLGWWSIAVQNSPFSEGGENRISNKLIGWLAEPSSLLIPLMKSVIVTFPDLVKGWIAIYGYGAGTVPPFTFFFSFIFLIFAFLAEPQTNHMPWGQRLFLFFMFVLGCFAIYSLVFIAVFDGVDLTGLTKHGRYNIPFVPLFFLAFTGLFVLPEKWRAWTMRVAIPFLLLAHVWFSAGIYATYYTYCGNAVLTGESCTLPVYKNLEKDSGQVVGLNSNESLQQAFTNQCGDLESVDVFVDSKSESGTGQLLFSLLDADGTTLASQQFMARDVTDGNYLNLPVKLPTGYGNKDFVIKLDVADTNSPEKFRFSVTPRDYYPGELTTSDGHKSGDLVIHYTCTTP